jgi:Zn-dependent protease
LKGLAETGKPDYRTDTLLAIAVAAATGMVTLVTFAWAFSWLVAFLMVGALFVHEFGHLLAYRLIGQPWGRMLFLPFLGAIAVPRLGFTTQGQSVFSAIMGPAFSIIVPIICALAVWWGVGESQKVFVLVGLVVAALNLFNLLPVEPLDGGVVLRSVFGWLLGRYARFGLMAVGGLILAAGFAFEQVLLVVFGALAVFANLPRRRIDAGLEPMSSLQISISTFGFVATVSAYVVLFEFFVQKAALG